MEETTESMDTGVEESYTGMESEGQEGSEGSEGQEDNSYDMDYKDDFEVPTEDTEEEAAEAEAEEYSQEDINEAMMEYIRDNYELPDKFKDVESLINSYNHLEGKMGSLKGAPDQYEINDDIFNAYGEATLDGIVPVAQEMGIDNDGLNKLLSAAKQAQTQEQDANWEMEKHKLGDNADAQITNAMQQLSATFTPEISEQIQGMVQTAADFRALQTIINHGTSQSTPAPAQSADTGMNDSKLNDMLYAKDSYGNLKMESDSNYASKVKNMMKEYY